MAENLIKPEIKNATQAAIRAKYSSKTAQEQSARLLSNVMVQNAIAERMKVREKRTKISYQLLQKTTVQDYLADRQKELQKRKDSAIYWRRKPDKT